MDVLVVVGTEDVPDQLSERATHRQDVREPARSHHRGGGPVPHSTGRGRRRWSGFCRRPGRCCGPSFGRTTGDVVCGRRRRHGPVRDTALAPVGYRAGHGGVAFLLDLVGETPLVRLDRVGRDLACHLLAKLEFLNPGGSVKDRPALAMIEAAEQSGLLHAGGTIVEPTSGNTGVGLAIVAARKGYHCVFVMPDKIAPEKIDLLRAYGAEVVVCPTTVAPEHPDSYYSVSDRLTREIPGAYKPNQYANPANPRAHETSTGPEIWRQTAGRITHFVAGIGTGGTITGVGRYLKSQNPSVQIVGADPEGSVYSGGSGRPYLVEGIGEDFWPSTYDPTVVDTVVMVSDRRLVPHRSPGDPGRGRPGRWFDGHGGVGRPPGGAPARARRRRCRPHPRFGPGLPFEALQRRVDGRFGFLRSGGQSVGEVIDNKGGELPPLIHVHPDERSAM